MIHLHPFYIQNLLQVDRTNRVIIEFCLEIKEENNKLTKDIACEQWNPRPVKQTIRQEQNDCKPQKSTTK